MSSLEIPNGSFEIDSDSDGVPDGWERGFLPGGAGGYDDGDSVHGARSYRFVHPGGAGNGGGYLESGFFPASALFFPPVRFACKASNPGTGVACVVRFYDRCRAPLGEREVYSSVSNPAAWGLVVVADPGGVPAGTGYARVRLVGGTSGADAAGTVWFDAVGVEGAPAPCPLPGVVDQAEARARSAKFVDVGRPWDIVIPGDGTSSWLVVGVELRGRSWTDEMGHGSCRPVGRFMIGDRVSSEASGPGTDEWGGPYLLSMRIDGLAGARQLRFQLRAEPGGEVAVALRSPAGLPRLLHPNTRVVDAVAGTVTDGWEGKRGGRP